MLRRLSITQFRATALEALRTELERFARAVADVLLSHEQGLVPRWNVRAPEAGTIACKAWDLVISDTALEVGTILLPDLTQTDAGVQVHTLRTSSSFAATMYAAGDSTINGAASGDVTTGRGVVTWTGTDWNY